MALDRKKVFIASAKRTDTDGIRWSSGVTVQTRANPDATVRVNTALSIFPADFFRIRRALKRTYTKWRIKTKNEKWKKMAEEKNGGGKNGGGKKWWRKKIRLTAFDLGDAGEPDRTLANGVPGLPLHAQRPTAALLRLARSDARVLPVERVLGAQVGRTLTPVEQSNKNGQLVRKMARIVIRLSHFRQQWKIWKICFRACNFRVDWSTERWPRMACRHIRYVRGSWEECPGSRVRRRSAFLDIRRSRCITEDCRAGDSLETNRPKTEKLDRKENATNEKVTQSINRSNV